jgi:hypothetical protein
MTPDQGNKVAQQIRDALSQYDRIANKAAEESVPGTAPREIERLIGNITNVHNDMMTALNTLKGLLP